MSVSYLQNRPLILELPDLGLTYFEYWRCVPWSSPPPFFSETVMKLFSSNCLMAATVLNFSKDNQGQIFNIQVCIFFSNATLPLELSNADQKLNFRVCIFSNFFYTSKFLFYSMSLSLKRFLVRKLFQ